MIIVSHKMMANGGIALAQTVQDPSVRWLEVSAPSFWLITVQNTVGTKLCFRGQKFEKRVKLKYSAD